MNSKHDIYYDGEIIVDFTGFNPNKNTVSKNKSYPVQGSHSFKDGEDVTGRYELKQSRQATEWGDGYAGCEQGKGDIFSIIAIPLPTPAPVEEQDDWFDRQTMQEVKKKIIEEIDSYPKDEIKQMAAAQNYAVDKTHPFNKLFTKLTDAFIAGVEWQKQNKQL